MGGGIDVDRDFERFHYGLFSGLVGLAINIYHPILAILDGRPIWPLESLIQYEAPLDLMLDIANCILVFVLAIWSGIFIKLVLQTIIAAVETRLRWKRLRG